MELLTALNRLIVCLIEESLTLRVNQFDAD